MVESNIARENAQRVLNAVDTEQERLNLIVGDWAPWMATHQFLSGADEWYAGENLDAATLTNLGVDFMLFYDVNGDFFYASAVDLESEESIELSPVVLNTFTKNDSVLTYNAEAGGV